MEPKEKISTVPWATGHIPPPWRGKGEHETGRDGGMDGTRTLLLHQVKRKANRMWVQESARPRESVSFIHLFPEGFETVLNKTVK